MAGWKEVFPKDVPGAPFAAGIAGVVIILVGAILLGTGYSAGMEADQAATLKGLAYLAFFAGIMLVGLPWLFDWGAKKKEAHEEPERGPTRPGV